VSGFAAGARRGAGTCIGALALLCACLPNPQSVRERRDSFDWERFRGTLVLDQVPDDARPVGAVFEKQFELVAVRTEPEEPKRGDRVRVTYYWRALEEVARDFRVFVHGDAMEGSYRRIHGDHWPAEGLIPTGVWRPGQIVADPFEIRIPSSYGPPRIGLYSGLYQGDDRLRLTDKGRVEGTSDNRSVAVAFDLDP
jgi:hypothetical protein